jgi:hypothetical protein
MKNKEVPQPLQTQTFAWCWQKLNKQKTEEHIKLNTVQHLGTEDYSSQIIIFQDRDSNLDTS